MIEDKEQRGSEGGGRFGKAPSQNLGLRARGGERWRNMRTKGVEMKEEEASGWMGGWRKRGEGG